MRDEILRAVKIFEQQIEQMGPLNDSRFNEAPLFRRNQERNDIDLPGRFAPSGSL